MDKIYYSKIASPTAGISRQIFNLVSSIVEANKQNIKMVALDNFTFHNSETSTVPVSVLLDLDKLNYMLSRRYGMYVYDKNYLQFSLRSIFYGVPNRDKNVTKEILDSFCDEKDVITIMNDISLNPIIGDPFIGVVKRLIINYTVKYKEDERYASFSVEEFAGHLKEDLIIDYNIDSADYLLTETPFLELHSSLFDHILKNISFNEQYINVAEEFINYINIKDRKITAKVNVIHLRLEEDVVEKWGKDKGDDYLTNLEQKYIELIKENIEKTDETIILSYSINNNVLAFLKDNEYNFYLKEKQMNAGREINAVVDLLMSKYCNHVFIGNFNESKMEGSAFSYYAMNQMSANVKKISVDL